MRNMYYVDMHCHTAPKPYSWSLKKDKKGWDCRNVRKSLWYNDPPRVFDKFINRQLGLTRFTQSDLRTLSKGEVRIFSAALSPIERGFVTPKFWPKILYYDLLNTIDCLFPKTIGGLLLIVFARLIIKAVAGFSMIYICRIKRKKRDYFAELCEEYKFYICEERKQQKANYPTIFKLTNNFEDIDPFFIEADKDLIYIFFSIEGCHVFNNGGLKSSLKDMRKGGVSKESKNGVKEKIKAVKKWTHPPFYISIAHHMNNDLCGHAKSLSPPLESIVNQKKGMNKGFTKIGEVVLSELLSKENGNRIYIDIKHMSLRSRYQYYHKLENGSYEDVPVFASHGAVNGSESIKNRVEEKYRKWVKKEFNGGGIKNLSKDVIKNYSIGNKKDKGNKKIKHYINKYIDVYQNESTLHFNDADVNFFDDEILRIEKSGGFLGIQIDERTLCSPEQKELNKKIKKRGEQLHHQAGLVWKQIRYIAKVLDDQHKPQFGWGTATIGSDFDGLVDPPNGYWSSEDFGILEENLIHHAYNYFRYHSDELQLEMNKHPAGKPPLALAKPKTKAMTLAKALADALAKPHAQDQATALSVATAEIKKYLKEPSNGTALVNTPTEKDDKEDVENNSKGETPKEILAKALAVVICLVRALGLAFIPALLMALGLALVKALCKPPEEDPLPPVQTEDEAMNNAMKVIDYFMRGNALRFLKDFYKDNTTIVKDLKENIECPKPK